MIPRNPARAAGTRPAGCVSRLGWRDLLAEAVAGLLQRPGRSLLTALGTILGSGAFVAILGLTATASGQIGKQFSVLAATTVTVNDVGQARAGNDAGGSGYPPVDFPADAGARAERLRGVIAAGVWWTVPLRSPVIGTTPDVTAASDANAGDLPVYAASAGMLRAMQPVISSGELYNQFDMRHDEQVAVLGPVAAEQLGIGQVGFQPAIFINGVPFTVVGIVSAARLGGVMLTGIMLPASTALRLYGPPSPLSPAQMIIRTRVGAAQLIARQAPLALRPDDPGLLQAIAPASVAFLTRGINRSLSDLFLALAAVSLLIGGAGIANTTLVAVLERTAEIGMRRALGARPVHIAVQFVTESSALGLLGGLIGTSLAVAAVVGTAIARQWTAILAPGTVLLGPAAGILTGLVAGLYPALRASSVQPLEALRR